MVRFHSFPPLGVRQISGRLSRSCVASIRRDRSTISRRLERRNEGATPSTGSALEKIKSVKLLTTARSVGSLIDGLRGPRHAGVSVMLGNVYEANFGSSL